MAEGKKISEKLAPVLKRYNGDTALFGNHIRWAWGVLTQAFHPIGDVSKVTHKEQVDEPSPPR